MLERFYFTSKSLKKNVQKNSNAIFLLIPTFPPNYSIALIDQNKHAPNKSIILIDQNTYASDKSVILIDVYYVLCHDINNIEISSNFDRYSRLSEFECNVM